jgi:serine/threonine-protein kinase HipA
MQADGQQIRIHQEDLCQAHALHPGVKYQADGGPSPASISELFRRVMPSRTAEDAVERFGDAVRLAPLYGISSALPYESMPVNKLRLAMKLGCGYELDARPSTWPILARSLGVSPDALTERARNLAVHAPDAFADAVGDPSVAPLSSALPARLLDAVAVRARQCLTALNGREHLHA